MLPQQQPDGAQRRLTRRFVGWVWHTDHDDRVPNIINGMIVAAMAVVMITGATSTWLILGLVATLVTALMLADIRTSPDRRASGEGRLDDSVALHRLLRRESGGRS